MTGIKILASFELNQLPIDSLIGIADHPFFKNQNQIE